ncbi:MAG: hypothetical protein IKQ90_10305 [Ruminococcus sp.]|nr:hypothetical protein [Ruminococcus sp.]
MTGMKKIILSVLLCAVCAAVGGCADKNESSSSVNESQPAATEGSSSTEATTEQNTTQTETETTQEETTEETTEPTEESVETETEAETEAETEPESMQFVFMPLTSKEYVDFIGGQIEISDIIDMAASMIGAEEGTSFMYNGNKFEIYRFTDQNEILSDAADGSITLNIEGFGDYTMNSAVNGNYLMVFDNHDNAVTDIFQNAF